MFCFGQVVFFFAKNLNSLYTGICWALQTKALRPSETLETKHITTQSLSIRLKYFTLD